MASILKKYERISRSPTRYRQEASKAAKWFKDVVSKLPIKRRALLNDDRVKKRTVFLPGRMYAFIYDPKHKKTLPYYDRFPLAILVEPAEGGGFYGINLHYLAPKTRAQFLSALMENNITQPGRELSDRTRFRITYSILKRAKRLKAFKPCFKHYLPDHVKGQMVEITGPDWETAIFLPVEHFAKSSKEKVWANSRRIIGV